jgi:hypothetical protein
MLDQPPRNLLGEMLGEGDFVDAAGQQICGANQELLFKLSEILMEDVLQTILALGTGRKPEHEVLASFLKERNFELRMTCSEGSLSAAWEHSHIRIHQISVFTRQ